MLESIRERIIFSLLLNWYVKEDVNLVKLLSLVWT